MPAPGRRQERCGRSCERCGQGPPRRRDARPLRDPQRVWVLAKPRVRDARAPPRPLRTRSLPGSSSNLRRGRRLKSKSPGAWGEDLALRYLIQHGYKLLERNYRTRRGQIDLIVRKDDTLVLVLRNKAIPEDAGHVQGAVGGHLDRDPEHLVDLVALLGA